LPALTSGLTPNGQVISVSEVEFSFLGQYEAAVKFAKSLKLSKRDSDIPIVVKLLSCKHIGVCFQWGGQK
jgi:hypothetical protein